MKPQGVNLIASPSQHSVFNTHTKETPAVSAADCESLTYLESPQELHGLEQQIELRMSSTSQDQRLFVNPLKIKILRFQNV